MLNTELGATLLVLYIVWAHISFDAPFLEVMPSVG